MPRKHQALPFSAAMTNEVKDAAVRFMRRLLRLPADATRAAEKHLLN